MLVLLVCQEPQTGSFGNLRPITGSWWFQRIRIFGTLPYSMVRLQK